ncbi:MAG: hypothetical protein IKI99_03805 [Firmicutes bacterium]|nr:hypothetical protein [Bacillota bacterium]
MIRVKKILCIIAIIFAVLFISLFTACEMLQLLSYDENIPRDYVDCTEYFDENGFQDYTDYCWYQYADTNRVKLPAQYEIITQAEIPFIKSYFDDFQGWMSAENRLDQYDFDQVCINVGDSYFLNSKYEGHRKFINYDLYFFDKETARLYFIHNNI